MQIILKDDVLGLGDAGAVVTVRDGYARNFLLPRKLAIVADKGNLNELEHHKRVVAARQTKLKGDAQQHAKQLDGLTLTFTRMTGEDGKLFGSVTTSDIAEALTEKKITVDRRRIRLGEPLKTLGEFPVEIKLHSEVSAKITCVVVAAA